MDEKERIYKKVGSILRQKAERSSYIGEDDYVSLVKGGIIIHFHIKNPNLDIENIFRTVKRLQKIVRDRLDHNIEKLDISIYDSKEELRQEGRSKSRYASWIAGIYDGKIRIISERDVEEPESLYIILTHEIMHLSIYEMSKGKCPYWLDEGLAVYFSQELPDDYLVKLQTAVQSDRILPLDFLEKPLPADTKEGIRQLAYAEASSITEYFIESHGLDTVKSIIQQCSRRHLKAILGDMSLNYYLIEQAWKRWMRGRIA